MSVIVHRCECGHIDMAHAEHHGHCSFGYCKCPKIRRQVGGPSELIATFRDGGVEVPTVAEPGVIFGSTLGGIQKTCGCPSCVAMHETVKAAS